MSLNIKSDKNIKNLLFPVNANDSYELINNSSERLSKSFLTILKLIKNNFDIGEHYSLFDLVERRFEDIHNVRRIRWLSSPLLRNWMNNFCRLELNQDGFIYSLNQLISSLPNYCIDIFNPPFFEIPFRANKGIIEIFDPSLSFFVPNSEDYVSITCKKDGQLIIGNPKKPFIVGFLDNNYIKEIWTQEDASLLRGNCLLDTNIVVRSDLPSLRVSICQDREPDRYSSIIGISPLSDDPSYPHISSSYLNRASELISKVWPEEFQDWKTNLQVIVPYKPPKNWKVGGFTISTYQGACWICNGNSIEVLENIVHEQSHIKLRYIEEEYKILEENQPTNLFRVGWRSDLRPIIGIVEGVYVNLHVIEVFNRSLKSCLLTSDETQFLLKRRKSLYQQVSSAFKILLENANFTSNGHIFMSWTKEFLDTNNSIKHSDL